MNKRQTRQFAIGATAISALAFLGLTIDSHRQFGSLTHADAITPAVERGQEVWHEKNCINCHTLLGEGAYYAPDLTKITQLRGAPYLAAFLKNPANFYNEQQHRRLMPKQDLSDADIDALIAFLDWVSKIDNQGWPPRPILVAGSSIPGMDLSIKQQDQAAAGDIGLAPGARPVTRAEDPIARGQAAFSSVSPPCSTCHSTAPNVNLVGPTLAGMSARVEAMMAAGTYKGSATDVVEYIKESIRNPNAHLVPGAMYSANGVSFMPTSYAKELTSEQIDDLAAYLSTLK